MKKETTEAKLNRLFGDNFVAKVEEVKVKTTGKIIGVSEEEIQEFRAVQGIIYFFKAPELFQYKICAHCGADFYVSRKYVAYCSYMCIKLELRKQGFEWEKGNDIEALVLDPQVYDGNEPLWISPRALQYIREMVQSLPENINFGTPSVTTTFTELQESSRARSSSRNTSTGETREISTSGSRGSTTSSTKKKAPAVKRSMKLS